MLEMLLLFGGGGGGLNSLRFSSLVGTSSICGFRWTPADGHIDTELHVHVTNIIPAMWDGQGLYVEM